MVVPILNKIAIFIVFCNIFSSYQDFLEYYQPRPGLPKELNDWLAFVQEHKRDFRIINNIVKRRKEEDEFYDEKEETQRSNLLENNEEEYMEEAPQNDIRPINYREKQQHPYKHVENNLNTNRYNENYNKNNFKTNSQNRIRRHSQKNTFFENSEKFKVEPNGQQGEIKRLQDKYPEQLKNDKKDDYKKREIQINVLNDGKLVKSIKETDKDSKSIVFNIESLQKPNKHNPSDNLLIERGSSNKIINTPLTGLTVRDRDGDLYVLYKNKNNLVTERSIYQNNMNDADLPNLVTIRNINTGVPHQSVALNNISANGFHRNNFNDMSKYWTDDEKHQLRNGIQFAHNTNNIKKLPEVQAQNSEISDGFEFAKSIVVDHKTPHHQQQNKRNLPGTEGKMLVQNPSDNSKFAVNNDIIELHIESTEISLETVITQGHVSAHLNKEVKDEDCLDDSEYNTEEKAHEKTLVNDLGYENKEISHEKELFNHHQQDKIKEHNGNEPINNHIDITIIEQKSDKETKMEHIKKRPVINKATKEESNSENVDRQQDNDENNNKQLIGLDEKIKEQHKEHKKVHHKEHNERHQEMENEKHIEEESEEHNERNNEEENVEHNDEKDNKHNEEQNKEHHEEHNEEYHEHINERNDEPNEERHEELNKDYSKEENNENYKEQHEELNNLAESTEDECIGKGAETLKSDEVEAESDQEEGFHLNKEDKLGHGKDIRLRIDINNNHERYLPNNLLKRNTQNKPHKHVYCKGPNCDMRLRNSIRKHHGNNIHYKRKNNNKNYISYYQKRELQSVDYIYDVNIEAPDYKATDHISSERTKSLQLKVEGDYGDEEDALPPKTNQSSKLIKKTDNTFANPRTVVLQDGDGDNDNGDDYYYDEGSTKQKNNHTDNAAKFKADNQQVGFGKRRHNKPKPVPAPKNQKPKNKETTKDTKSFKQGSRSKAGFEDFRQLPNFVINDRIKEENLRKRSLTSRRESPVNKFPLSSKGFFTNSKAKRRDLADENTTIVKYPNISDLEGFSSTVAGDNLNPVDQNSSLSTLINFNDLPGINAITTMSPSTSTEAECEVTTQVSIGDVCQTENFSQNKILMTTMLSFIPDIEEEMAGQDNETATNEKPDEKFEKLDEILTGQFPINLVNSIYDHMKTNPSYRNRFYGGMRRRHNKISSDSMLDVSRQESRKLVNSMEEIINQLQWTVNCQTLPPRHRQYLGSITKAKVHDALSKTKEMEEVEFDDTQNEQNFIFSSSSEGNMAQKSKVLQDMLARFDKLPDDCKTRAEPVKKYIQDYLTMLERANKYLHSRRFEKVETETEPPHQQPKRRNQPPQEKNLVEEQLESLGLGKNHNFKPNFNLDDMVHKSKMNIKNYEEGKASKSKANKKTKKRQLDAEVSDNYEKLLEAVKKQRIKREGQKRLAKTFGKLDVADYNGESSNNAIKDVFESPLVYTI